MLKIIEDRIKQREERLEVARAYLERLSAHVGKLTGIVYGSTARGDFKDWSDIDVVVVAEKLPQPPMKRLGFLYDFSEGRIEPKGFTVEEFKEILDSSFGRLLKKEGVAIIDELEIFGAKSRRRR